MRYCAVAVTGATMAAVYRKALASGLARFIQLRRRLEYGAAGQILLIPTMCQLHHGPNALLSFM